MNIAIKLTDYIKNSRQELKKVIWPSKKTTTQHTIMVIVFSLSVAALLGAIDYVLNFVLNLLIAQ